MVTDSVLTPLHGGSGILLRLIGGTRATLIPSECRIHVINSSCRTHLYPAIIEIPGLHKHETTLQHMVDPVKTCGAKRGRLLLP